MKTIFEGVNFGKHLKGLNKEKQKEFLETICNFSQVVKSYLKMQRINEKHNEQTNKGNV